MQNIFNIENWIIVGLALLKMASFFWPVMLLACVFMLVEWKKESLNAGFLEKCGDNNEEG